MANSLAALLGSRNLAVNGRLKAFDTLPNQTNRDEDMMRLDAPDKDYSRCWILTTLNHSDLAVLAAVGACVMGPSVTAAEDPNHGCPRV